MTKKTTNLDAATLRVVKQVLAMPPKHHEDMKIGQRKKRGPKDCASSSKPRTA